MSTSGAPPDPTGSDQAEVDPCGVDPTAVDLSRAVWRTSSYSGGNGSCVEVADLGEHVAVRDSKDRQGPRLVFKREAWREFISDIRSGTQDP